MRLREFVVINKDCDDLYIRESDGNFSRPLFTRTLTNSAIPSELLDREVKHIQSGNCVKYGRTGSCIHITLVMKSRR